MTKGGYGTEKLYSSTFYHSSLSLQVTYPFGKIDKTTARRLQKHGTPVRRAGEPKFSEGCIELDFLLGHTFDFLTEAFECGFELVPEFSLGLLGGKIVTVMHVLVLAKISRNLTDFRIKLHVHVFLLAEHYSVLFGNKMKQIIKQHDL